MLFLVAVQKLITMESLIFVGVNFRGMLKFNWLMGHTFEFVSYFILQTEILLYILNLLSYGGCSI